MMNVSKYNFRLSEDKTHLVLEIQAREDIVLNLIELIEKKLFNNNISKKAIEDTIEDNIVVEEDTIKILPDALDFVLERPKDAARWSINYLTKEQLIKVCKKFNWRIMSISSFLGVHHTTLGNRLRKLNINKDIYID